jgi:predicted dehydrogenase
LNWDFWLGPAPWREHCHFHGKDSVHWHWRWVMDYSGGQLTDWAGHHVDIAHWGLGKDSDGPVEVEGKGTFPTDGLYDTPYEYRFTCTYADGLPMVVANDKQVQHGTKWIGEKGWIHVDRGRLNASDPKILQEKIGPGGIHLYVSDNHHQNFLDCLRSRQLTVTPAETAHRSISVALLGEIAMLTGRKIKWNPKTEEIVGDAGAAALLGRPYREPWSL